MTAEYVIALLGLAGSLGSVAALIWAVRRRQLQTGDRAMYEAIADDEPDYSGYAAPVRPGRMRWLFATALALVFLLVCWLLVETVRVGTRPVPAPPAARQSFSSPEQH